MNDIKLRQTIATYDKTAPTYAADSEQKQDLGKLAKFMQLLKPRGKILDIGCGSGKDTVFFQRHGFSTTGIDLSKNLLAEAKKLHPGIRVQLMDMRSLKFPDNYFTGVWAHASIHHLEPADISTAFQEIFRVLEPGGYFYCSIKAGDKTEPVEEIDEQRHYRYFTYFTLPDLRVLLEKHGFLTLSLQKEKSKHRNLYWIFYFGQKSN